MEKSKKIKIIISIAAISFIQGLQYSVSPVLREISGHFPEVRVSLVQMLVTAPAILSMFVALASGWLVTKISKKKLLVFAAFLAGITGFMPFLSDSFPLLFISRAMFGISLGLACTLNTAVCADFFTGDERTQVMGIQAASIGAGMVVITTGAGWLGSIYFTHAYFINALSFLSMLLIALLLPETDRQESGRSADGKQSLDMSVDAVPRVGISDVRNENGIRLNKRVYFTSIFGMIEFIFLITFTTNIAMHLSGVLAGNTQVSGVLTGIFSGAQIIMGLVLGIVTKITKRLTLPAAMLCFSLGGILLIFFGDNYLLLIPAAILCGFSQGMFIPQAMTDVANAVNAASTAMAAAVFTCFMSFGQLISPTLLNAAASFFFGEASTGNVYLTAVIGMTAAAGFLIFFTLRSSKKGKAASMN